MFMAVYINVGKYKSATLKAERDIYIYIQYIYIYILLLKYSLK